MVEYERRDLICLHLEAHAQDLEQSPVPTSVTAAGIGDALELGETAVGRVHLLETLSALQEDGLIDAEERPVANHDAPRTVYALTDAGAEHATNFRQMARRESVDLENGIEQEVDLGNIDQYIEDDAPLLTALVRLTDDGTVPLEERGAPSFVNRDEALKVITDAIEASLTKDAQTITVAGTSGMGKTALVREALDRFGPDRENLVTARGTCPAGTTNPYESFRQIFEAVPDDGVLLEGLMEAKTSFTPEDPAERDAQRNAFFSDIAEGLEDVAAEQPIVVFLDNLQWADQATLNLFAHLTTAISDWLSEIAFVGAYRQDAIAGGDHRLVETLERIETDTAVTDITIGPLGREDTRRLLTGIIGGQDLPEGFVDLVHGQTGGNPLFIRETATHMIESNLVDTDLDVYPTSPDQVTLPQEVTDQIDQRLMALDENSRQLLRLGAIAGERVPGQVLAEASNIPAAKRREYEDVLISSHIWEQISPAVGPGAVAEVIADGGHDFQFVSGGLREAVVDRLPENLAPRYHAQVAEAFETVFEGSLDDHAGQIAYHYEQAEEFQSAIEYYRRAGHAAQVAYANEDAVSSYRRAIDLAEKHEILTDEEIAALCNELADIHHLTGDYHAAVTVIEDGLDLASEDSQERCELLGTKAHTESRRGKYDQAREIAQRQLSVAENIGATDLEADALFNLGTAAWQQGDPQSAQSHLEAARSRFEAAGDDAGLAKTEKNLGNVASIRLDDDQARNHYAEARERYEALNDRHGLAIIHNNLSIIDWRNGDHESAFDHLEEAIDEYEDVGDRQGRATSLLNLGAQLCQVGELESGEAHLKDAMEGFQATGDRHSIARVHRHLGVLEQSRGNLDAARDYLEPALDGFQNVNHTPDIAIVHRDYGDIAREQGQYQTARNRYREAKELFESIDQDHEVGRCLLHLGRVSHLEGDMETASNLFDDALALFEEMEDDSRMASTYLHQGELARDTGDFEAAEAHFDRAANWFEARGDAWELARLELARGELALAKENLGRAQELAEKALDEFEERESVLWISRTRRLLGQVSIELGAPGDAKAHLQTALETFESIGAPQDALDVLKSLVELARNAGETETMEEWLRRAESCLSEASDEVAEQHRGWVHSHQSASG